MSISAHLVKELRDRTGAGMMECKNALLLSDGDIEKAVEKMRKDGQAKADKKADRTAAEGIITLMVNEEAKAAAMLEINSETDFVARDVNLNEFAKNVANTALSGDHADLKTLSAATFSGTTDTVEQARQTLVAKIGENIKLRRMVLMKTDGVMGSYVHGNRIGVLVELKGGDESLAKDLAMHIAASRPLVVNRDDVNPELIAKEREIFTAQAQETGKPAEIIEKMIGGRINKFLDEVSLLGQPFVKNPDIHVGQLLKERQATVIKFIRFEVGEGIEKKEDNFVAEVMAQVRDA